MHISSVHWIDRVLATPGSRWPGAFRRMLLRLGSAGCLPPGWFDGCALVSNVGWLGMSGVELISFRNEIAQ